MTDANESNFFCLSFRGIVSYRSGWLKRFIDAIRFFPHVFPGEFIGPCPTTSADLSKLAPSTFSLIAVCISKVLEEIGFFPNLPEMFFPDISTIQL
jgi:hypothetical protein